MVDLRELILKVSQAKDKQELQSLKSEFLGKNSQINQEFKKLGSLPEDQKKVSEIYLKDLSKDCEKFNVAIGIIATPGQYAQAVADELINCGVRSILNFAPVLLKNVPDVQIRSVDLSQELQILSYYLDRPVLKAVV